LPAAQNLDDALDFILSADDRIGAGLQRQFGQIAPERIQRGVLSCLFALFFLF